MLTCLSSYVLSKPLPVFRRCVPMEIGCYAEFFQGFITFVSDNTVLRRVLAGVVTSKEVIIGLCLLALGTNLPDLPYRHL